MKPVEPGGAGARLVLKRNIGGHHCNARRAQFRTGAQPTQRQVSVAR